MKVIKIVNTMIVNKNEEKRLLTLPVLIPDYDDCDAPHGEKQLSVEEIADFSHKYMEKYRKVDGGHTYLQNKKEVAVPVESWQLREDTAMKTIDDEEITYPMGTWMATLKVFDDGAWDNVSKGFYTGGSVTVLEESVADEVVLKEAAEKGRVLIKDIPDPAVATIALVDKPCVFGAKFCSVKAATKSSNTEQEFVAKKMLEQAQSANKAGRSISNSTFSKIKTALDSLSKLMDKAVNEREETPVNKGDEMTDKEDKLNEKDEFVKKEDLESFKTDFKSEITEEVTKAVKEAMITDEDKRNDKIASVKSELENLGVDTSKIDFSPKSNDEDEKEEDPEIKGSQKSLDNHETGEEKTAVKNLYDDDNRDIYGRIKKQ
jgi:hypothetical protein